jgi:heat shock protein HtpX
VAALVKFAGGHDPGPLALRAAGEAEAGAETEPTDQSGASGPWSEAQEAPNPFLPQRPPIELGSPPPADPEPGPWGPHRK